MVIDDSELVLSVVRSFLSSAGHEVVTRSMAVGTHAAVLRARPDVVLLDVNMPLLEGNEICASIRAHDNLRATRILLHSDRPEEELRTLANQSGADGYLCKTSQREKFLERFAQLSGSASQNAGPPPVEGYVLAACSPATQRRLRTELVSPLRVEYTDSGTEALRRVFSPDAPKILLLGTSLADMQWDVIRSQATRRNPAYSSRTLLIREDSAASVPRDARSWDPSRSVAELEDSLTRIHAQR